MPEFRMPSLGADMDEGTVVEWLVKVGDVVSRGDIVAVVDTTKSAIEVEVFQSGVIEDILVEAGTTVPVGTPLAVLGSAAEAPASEPSDGEVPGEAVVGGSPAEPLVASPIVRHLAHALPALPPHEQGQSAEERDQRTDDDGAPAHRRQYALGSAC